MCQHLKIEEMIRLHRTPQPGGVRPTEQDLREKTYAVVENYNLVNLAANLYHGQYRDQLEKLSTADAADHLMDAVVMNPDYTPQPGRFVTYARKSLFLYAAQIVRDEKRERDAMLTRARRAAPARTPGLPQPAGQARKITRMLLRHLNKAIPHSLLNQKEPELTDRDKAYFAAAIAARVLLVPGLPRGYDGPILGRVGFRNIARQAGMPQGVVDRIWKDCCDRNSKRGPGKSRGFQKRLADCCDVSEATVSRSLRHKAPLLIEPCRATIARAIESLRKEAHTALMAQESRRPSVQRTGATADDVLD